MKLPIQDETTRNDLLQAGRTMEQICHNQAATMGWWEDYDAIMKVEALSPGQRRLITMWYQATKLMLTVSEVAEAMEGLRKGSMDDHLPQRATVAAELADTVIRSMDLGGAMGLDLGAVIVEKLHYNASREDHSREARATSGGKKF